MAKLKLDLENLALESFDSVSDVAPREKGTVQGHDAPQTQQVKCTYFCTYACPTGMEC
ncbi:hypothetical protein [Longimicrobium sp.]|uniref:hypothetical protein n=1 Tax=Longimicrobium sp. TaxID=2029185 RepID=UPI002CEABE32|nr:hypothetical protein [Longimicrobium sp.]HSU16005.1 hypothetical protein [Longimicrobium sp.]